MGWRFDTQRSLIGRYTKGTGEDGKRRLYMIGVARFLLRNMEQSKWDTNILSSVLLDQSGALIYE
jgi:hypothetical protein